MWFIRTCQRHSGRLGNLCATFLIAVCICETFVTLSLLSIVIVACPFYFIVNHYITFYSTCYNHSIKQQRTGAIGAANKTAATPSNQKRLIFTSPLLAAV